jgi:hypothetical protein
MFEGLLKKPNLSQEEIDFLNHELELLAKKNGAERKPTAKQVENAAIAEQMVAEMQENRLYSVTEISKEISAVAGRSTQSITPMLTAMVEAGKVAKTIEKGRSYYKVVVG